MKRRDFLRLLGLGGIVFSTSATGLILNACNDSNESGSGSMAYDPRSEEGFVNMLKIPGEDGLYGFLEPEVPFEMKPRQMDAEILPGMQTKSYLYEAQHQGKTFYNPIIKIRKDDALDITLVNQLDEITIIHWHGLEVAHEDDGHPNNAVGPGASYNYNFSVPNRGGTYWYHPHPDKLVGEQSYFGLGSFFIVEDDENIALKDALDLELGVNDIPLIIQDRNFNDQGQLVFETNPMLQTLGVLGDTILVNKTVKPYLDVDTRIYRFRILNASNSRIYKLSLDKNGTKIPFLIVGNDGGLLDKPYEATEFFIDIAERVEILIDFRGHEVGDDIYLKSGFFDPMDPLVDNMEYNRPNTLLNGDEFYVMKFNVKNQRNYNLRVPETLSIINPIDTTGADERMITLPNPIEGVWFINNFRFEPNEVPLTVNRNTIETWRIENAPLAMPHPMHIHAFQFQVLERINSPDQVSKLAIDSSGRLPTDMGWKDTVMVWPGEIVRYAINFSTDYAGDQLYLFHCHILEHEDQGMMINYKVV